jgi:hypothetical protein
MMRAGTSAIVLGLFVLGLCAGLVVPARAQAQSTAPHIKTADHGLTVEEFSAQSRRVIRRAPQRVPIYRGSIYPGPNSRRVCNAHYEQEYRPSGTVIVPRMNCYWSG